jgi:hypothetical protein
VEWIEPTGSLLAGVKSAIKFRIATVGREAV